MIRRALNNLVAKIAVVYLRRSTDKQDRSIVDQREVILRHAREHGFEIVDEFVDNAVSGTSTTGRREFRRMMQEALSPSPRFQYILVYDFSRFSRDDPFEAISQFQSLRKNGVQLVSVTQPLPDDDSLYLYLPFTQLQAHSEVKKVSLNTIRGQLSRAKEGYWLGGTPPYGFDLQYLDSTRRPYLTIRFLENGERHLLDEKGRFQRVLRKGEKLSRSNEDRTRLIPGDPRRVAVVERIFKMYAAGFGYKAIAATLNTEGVPSPRGGRYSKSAKTGWSRCTIKSMIDNPVYTGTATWNRRTFAKLHRVADGQAVPRPSADKDKFDWNEKSNHVVLEGAHTPIVKVELLERCRRIQRKRRHNNMSDRRNSGRAKTSPYLLSGLITCGNCDHRFIGQTVNKGKRRNDGSRVQTRYYQCGGYTAKGTAVCTKAPIPKEAIEEAVVARIRSEVQQFFGAGGHKLLRKVLRQALKLPKTHDQENRNCEREIAKIEADIDRLLDNLSATTKEFIERKVATLKEKRDAIVDRRDQIQSLQAAVVNVDTLADEMLPLIREFDPVFAEGTVEEQKEFIVCFVEGIEVDPKERIARVRIRKFPAPETLDAGKLSFAVVAGARCKHQKIAFPPLDVIEIPLVHRGSVLVPAAAAA